GHAMALQQPDDGAEQIYRLRQRLLAVWGDDRGVHIRLHRIFKRRVPCSVAGESSMTSSSRETCLKDMPYILMGKITIKLRGIKKPERRSRYSAGVPRSIPWLRFARWLASAGFFSGVIKHKAERTALLKRDSLVVE